MRRTFLSSRNIKLKIATLASVALAFGGFSAPIAASAVSSTVNCSTSGYIAIANGVVTNGSSCAGFVDVPSGVTVIGNSAFGANQNLQGINFPSSLTLVENSAFGAASNLVSITFAGNAPTVENSAFGAVGSGATAFITNTATGYGPGAWNGLTVFSLDGVGSGSAPCSTSGSVSIVAYEAMTNSSCTGVATIPTQVATIRADAFIQRTTVSRLNAPAVTAVINGAFYGTSGLISAHMPSVVTVGQDSFNSSRITKLDLPRATYLGPSAFSNNPSLVSVNLPAATGLDHWAFSGDTSLALVNMPHVTSIGNRVFNENAALTSISLPSATGIGDFAFFGATSLSTINLPSVTTIGTNSFENDSALTSIALPASLGSIGDRAFKGSTQLARVSFAGNAPTVGTDAFSGLPSGATAEITYPATGFGAGPTWNGLTIQRAAGPPAQTVTQTTQPQPYSGPVISGRTPRTINTEGGSEAAITGDRLAQVNSILMDGKALTIVSKSDAEIVFKAPAHAPGFVDLHLKSDTASLTFQDAFEYLAPALVRVPVTTTKTILVSSATSETLTKRQRDSVNWFVDSAYTGGKLTCSATYTSKKDAVTAKKLALGACVSAKKANSALITRVSALVASKTSAPRKILLSLSK